MAGRLTPERAVREILIADADVAGLIGRRIYAQQPPQGAEQPYIVYTRISTTRFPHMGGPTVDVQLRLQLDLYAADPTAARELAKAVRLALDGYSVRVTVTEGYLDISSITLEGDSDNWAPPLDGGELGQDSVTHDYLVWCDEVIAA